MKTTQQIELDTQLTQELIKMVPVATGLMSIIGISILGWWVSIIAAVIAKYL